LSEHEAHAAKLSVTADTYTHGMGGGAEIGYLSLVSASL